MKRMSLSHWVMMSPVDKTTSELRTPNSTVHERIVIIALIRHSLGI
jgi:hypothetical protein